MEQLLLLDTNIPITYNRNRSIARRIEEDYQLFSEEKERFVSVVTLAEIQSLFHQYGVGDRRRIQMTSRLREIGTLDIHYQDVLDRYEEIDAFSRGRHRSLVANFPAIKMGKNALWIAATAAAFDLTLVTTDGDFDHLDGVFLKLIRIPLAEYLA